MDVRLWSARARVSFWGWKDEKSWSYCSSRPESAPTYLPHWSTRKRTENAVRETHLACIIRERPASDEFARHKIAEEDDGSVKLLCGTWRQALQAHTIKAAVIFGRGFPWCSVGSGENGNSSEERSSFYPGDAPSSIAMCRKVARNGNDCGKCMTMRRAEATTLAPSFRKRSRSVQTCALAQLVPASAISAIRPSMITLVSSTLALRRVGRPE